MKTLDETILGMTKLVLAGKTDDVTEVIRSATHYLKEYKDFKDEIISEQGVCSEYQDACNKCGVETKVEKRKMKNPNNKVYRCLNCGQYMHESSWSRKVNYCSFCGMKIDWSNIKNE